MKPDLEQYLWDRINEFGQPFDMTRVPKRVIADMLAQGMIQSPKQAWRTLEKWLTKDLYDYGVAVDCGWKTPRAAEERAKGEQQMAALIAEKRGILRSQK